MNTILLFRTFFGDTNLRESEGVYAYAHKRGWQIRTIEYNRTEGGQLSSLLGDSNGFDLAYLKSFWEPDGCIIACGGRKCILDVRQLGATPFVLLDCDEMPRYEGLRFGCVCADSNAVASVAAKALLSFGYESYAFVPWCEPQVAWSRCREKEFGDIIRKHGGKMHLFRHADSGYDLVRIQRELAKWQETLPRPCGVFAVNDLLADAFVSAAIDAGFDVPQDFGVIGVDDDERLCENSSKTITSIGTDNVRAGMLACEMLEDLMNGSGGESSSMRLFGSPFIHSRASLPRLRIPDGRILKGLEYIRRHATDGIRPSDVVREMGCSRRLADLRFGEVVGHSILEEIHRNRIEKVKRLLRSPQLEVSTIADFCGYSSMVDLRRVFKRREGVSMLAWRKNALLDLY